MMPHDLELLLGLGFIGIGVLSGLHWLHQARPRLTLDNLRPLERLSSQMQQDGAANADRRLFDLGVELHQAIEATKDKAQ
jgi:hypothetical protein